MGRNVVKIVSGGQTGADRAALEWAIQHGIPHGGWCPKGRSAEDGPINPVFELVETPTGHNDERTEWNVRDSDGTVIFTIGETLTRGSARTMELARQMDKPCLWVAQRGSLLNFPMVLRCFVGQNQIKVLNVAGSRASVEPEIGLFVRAVLDATFFER